MQLRHVKTVAKATDHPQKVTALAFSPNNMRFAICTVDRVVHLYDETGEHRDKFSTKPSQSNGPKTYLVRGMFFSPDSTKLAIAQSDNIVFVYKLGATWEEKKSICNKFHQNSSVTTLTWPSQRPGDVVFGLSDGHVKAGQLRNNKTAPLYQTDSYVVSMSSSIDGTGFVSGHLDGSIYKFSFTGEPHMKVTHHDCVPYALAWGEGIAVAGNDLKVVFYTPEGGVSKKFDYSSDPDAKEFVSAAFNPSGETVAIGSFNRYHVFNYSMRNNLWQEAGAKNVQNYYTVTALTWKADGSRLAVGSLCGAVDLYEACIRRYIYKGKFEFTYLSLSQVMVKRLVEGTRIALRSHFGCEILKIDIFRDQYLVAHTPETLLVGDLASCKLSEVPWSGNGREKFYFENPSVCMIFSSGELTLIEYGRNDILESVRTEHMSSHLISARLNEAKGDREENKKIAYLLDLQTVRVLDLVSRSALATIIHTATVDWLELNERGTHLLFRDRQRQLHLYDLAAQSRYTLLSYCSYVQWVPGSDVVVAQNRGNLCVWYSIKDPERITIFPIKGEVEEIERSKGKTEVIVDEGINTVYYSLDESLIEFTSAVEDSDFDRAVDLLEQLELTPETEALWQSLADISLQENRIEIAERCYAALGDVARARYLHKVNSVREEAQQEIGGDGTDHFLVRARLAMLNKNYKLAEQELLRQNQVEGAMQMYQVVHKWEEALRLAEQYNHPEAMDQKRTYFKWLVDTGQEEKAGQMMEREGEYDRAIKLYLDGNLPAKAAHVVEGRGFDEFPSELLEAIAAALFKSRIYRKAGKFCEDLGMEERAMEAYRKGKAFKEAVDLARNSFPDKVVRLEHEWGEYLVSQRQLDGAVGHFIEAGETIKAIEAAIASKQWSKAVQIVDSSLSGNQQQATRYLRQIAKHFEDVRHYDKAKAYYLKAGCPQDAVEMYCNANKWSLALKLAETHMEETEMKRLYVNHAQKLEQQGKYKDAEKLYCDVKEPDLAINMYKKSRQYDNMIRLVGKYRKELLQDTFIHLAQQFENEKDFKRAEHHYLEAKDWKSVVSMYRVENRWDDAIRVAKLHGGVNALKQVAFARAVSMGSKAGAAYLHDMGLIELAIDYAIESGAFEDAYELASLYLKHKLPEVYLKHAMCLEDDGSFKEAEEKFIKAEKPKEAIDMYLHQQDYDSALRVSENYDPESTNGILVQRAGFYAQNKDFARAERDILKAGEPKELVRVYQDLGLHDRASEFANQHGVDVSSLPPSDNVPQHHNTGPSEPSYHPTGNAIEQGEQLYRQGRYSEAIDAFLRIGPGDISGDRNTVSDKLEEVWERTTLIAQDKCPNRVSEVIEDVGKKLVSIQRFEVAAEMYTGISKFEDAIDVYLMGGFEGQARALVQTNSHNAPHLKAYLQSKLGGGGANPSMGGNSDIEMYANNGDWDGCLRAASALGPVAENQYACLHAEFLLNQDNPVQAVKVLAEHWGTAAEAKVVDDNSLPLFNQLARHLTAAEIQQGQENGAVHLAHFLQKLVPVMQASKHRAASQFADLQLIAHYMAVISQTHQRSPKLAAKAAASLLRFASQIPADKAFYEAGIHAKRAKMLSLAFVFLNRYLDLAELMEDQEESASVMDNSDFVGTGIPIPDKYCIADHPCLSDEAREEVRDWVLEISMDQSNVVDPELPARTCDQCSADVFEGALVCSSCNTESKPCVVTGYPVLPGARTQCKGCSQPANREDWNSYLEIFRKCPWCLSQQSPSY